MFHGFGFICLMYKYTPQPVLILCELKYFCLVLGRGVGDFLLEAAVKGVIFICVENQSVEISKMKLP